SRRRHTRFSRDWSSDVCSSDLHQAVMDGDGLADGLEVARGTSPFDPETPRWTIVPDDFPTIQEALVFAFAGEGVIVRPGIHREKIGRASCRERVEVSLDGGCVE